MPTYYLNVRTPSHIAASLEVEHDDLTALRNEMARFVGELLRDHAALIWADQDWRVDVTDHVGLILYVLEIAASDTAATMSIKR
jgi:hypothetical protein